MIELRNISKSFGERVILDDVSVVFEKGKTNLIIGQSGSGKTVLMKSIVGLHEVDSGEIRYDNLVFNNLSFNEKKKLRKEIGMLFQGGALFDSLTVLQNVLFPLEMFTEMNFREKVERANFCLERVHMAHAGHLYPSEISGGMKKRAAIARAISLNPRYLFCDEPNSGLDPQTSIVIDQLIKEITVEFNITTIVNTHDMNSVMEIGDKIVFIYQGRKEWEGTRDEVLKTNNQHLVNFIFASALGKRVRETLV